MPEVKLSDGNTAVVRELEDMTRGDVRGAFKLADLDGVNTGTGQLGMDTVGALQDAILVRFVESWTLTDKEGKPLAVTMKTIKGLKLKDYNPLATAVAPVLGEVISGSSETPDPTSEELSSPSDDTDSTND
jgi:hypothetical protein